MENITGSRYQAVEGSIVNAISFESCAGLKRGLEVYKEERGLAMEYSDAILGKVFNPYGDTIDGTKVEEPPCTKRLQ